MKQINKKININNLGMLLLLITIVTFSIIIGGNEKNLPILPIGILTGFCLIILLIKKIKYKEKIIKSKLDIAITVFMVIIILPLIFQTYCTYEGTIEFILKYFFVYSMYLLARNTIDTNKKVNVLIVTTIISSFAIIIFGFDMLNGKLLRDLYNFLDINYDKSYRFTSTFGYANTVSIYLTLCVFLAINRIENVKKIIIKVLYILYIILCSYIIYISYSRFVLILYVMALVIYLGPKVYLKIRYNKKILKRIAVVTVLSVFLCTLYVKIACKYSKPCNLNLNTTIKVKKAFEPNKEYTFTFDLEVLDEEEQTNTYLKIAEVNKFFKQTNLIEKKLVKGTQKVELKIVPTNDLYYIKIKAINENTKKDKDKNKIIINKCYINGEEYVWSYKYIPRIISRLITSFNMIDDSVFQRIQFWENCIRIAKDSPIIGHGGNAWKRLALAYEDYPYAVKETHSYFFELLISYGIVGVIAFLTIIALVLKKFIQKSKKDKEWKKHNLSIFVGLMLFVGYSLIFDFTMSYILTIFIVFLYIALLQKDSEDIIVIHENDKKKSVLYKTIDWSILFTILVIFVILVKANIGRFCVEDIEDKLKLVPYRFTYRQLYLEEKCTTTTERMEQLQQIMLKEPYLKQVITYKKYWELINRRYSKMEQDKLIEYIDFGIERFKKIKPVSPMYFSTVIDRAEKIVYAIETLQKIDAVGMQSRIQDLRELLKEESNVNLENMNDSRRHYKSDEEITKTINEYKKILEGY